MDVREKLIELSDIQVLQREIECVKRKSTTNCTDCLNCDLLMTDERILTAYKNAIVALQNAHGVTVQEQKSPCSLCGYGGKHLDAPPCTTCPAHPKEQRPNEPLTLDELRKMDGAPVRHGRWENGCVCSNCTTHFGPKNNAAALYYRYCPFCGARMDASEQQR